MYVDLPELRRHPNTTQGVHNGGPEDPRLCLIRVQTVTAQYCIARKGIIAGAIALAKGVTQGTVPSINKIRHISEEDAQQWRSQGAALSA